ncbi:MAG: N-acetylmuramoyl-L-alanine amidase [Sarcina sp.]|nr:N-acetylmuramoyl-L-alanine amidase [Sarcina sp.]
METSPAAADLSAAAATSDPAVSAAAGTASAAAAPEYKGLVVIDPGHQKHANTEQEPVGPGASETKFKVSGGTTGTATGVPEYKLTLDIGLQLRDKLLERGYRVIMVRDTNDVDISNSERAEIANEADADVFIRLHANGSPDSSVTGAMTICQTPVNPYNGDIYEQSRALSENILDSYIYKTGINRQNVWETDTMSGINWSKVPATILEMGFMSNTGEDRSMQDDDMQQKMVEGIADGIDEYMKQFPPKEREETFFRQNEEEEASSEQNNSRETSEEDFSKKETSGETEETSEEESGPDGETKAETKEGIKEETEGPPEGTAAAEDN